MSKVPIKTHQYDAITCTPSKGDLEFHIYLEQNVIRPRNSRIILKL